MSDLAKALALAGVGVAGLTTVLGALLWLLKPRAEQWVRDLLNPLGTQIAETHKQVTENHHSNEKPTLLDKFDDMEQIAAQQAQAIADLRTELIEARAEFRKDVLGVRDDLTKHLFQANEAEADMWKAIEAVAKAKPPEEEP